MRHYFVHFKNYLFECFGGELAFPDQNKQITRHVLFVMKRGDFYILYFIYLLLLFYKITCTHSSSSSNLVENNTKYI